MASSIVGPTLKTLADQTGSSLNEISVLFAFKSFGFLLGSFWLGRAYDKWAGHPIMVGALITIAFTLLLVPVLEWLVLLTGVAFLLGVAMGSLDVGGNTLLIWVHRNNVGPYMNGLHFVWGLGGVLAPLLLIALTSVAADNVRWTYWLIALFLVPVLFWLLQIQSPQSSVSTREESEGGGDYLFVGLVSLFYFLYIGAEVSTSGWIVTYAVETELATESAAAILSSLFFGTLTLTRLISIPLAARYRPSQLLLFDLVVCLLSALLMVLQPHSWYALQVGVAGLGIGMATIFPIMLSFAQNRMELAGRVTSWFFLGGSLGGMSIPWLVGQVFEAFSPQVVLYSILVCTLGATVIFGVLKAGWERAGEKPLVLVHD